ncbi:MAG TPA: (2Fe-2S)-binding protein [Terriglobales bacterium]|nr:(2Fe-2S)-binding protein [Terriglobales bacterium]
MSEMITLLVNGRRVSVPQGASVAVAIATSGAACRRSVKGEPRSVLCGMGICFECRAQINGRPHQRTCQIVCATGMQVSTQNDLKKLARHDG